MIRKESGIEAFVHDSVMAMTSGLRSSAVAFNSSIFVLILRAFVNAIFSLLSVPDGVGEAMNSRLWAVVFISYFLFLLSSFSKASELEVLL